MKTLPKYEDIVSCPRPIALPAKSQHAPKISLVRPSFFFYDSSRHVSTHLTASLGPRPGRDARPLQRRRRREPASAVPRASPAPHARETLRTRTDRSPLAQVTFNGVEYTVKVKKRPHMEYFLKRVAELFEVVVFTASHRAYAETLLNLLDPHRRLIKCVVHVHCCAAVSSRSLVLQVPTLPRRLPRRLRQLPQRPQRPRPRPLEGPARRQLAACVWVPSTSSCAFDSVHWYED